MPEGGTFEFDQGVNNNYKHFSLFIYRLSACPYMSLMSNPSKLIFCGPHNEWCGPFCGTSSLA